MTSAPSLAISPMNSWPITIGTLMVFCDQASQFQMWMSVPQMLALRTLISTSLGPISGTGTSCIQIPRLGLGLDQRPHRITPRARPTLAKAAMARSSCSRVCAADIWVRMRAWPCGTTG